MVRLMGFEPTQVALPPPQGGASAVPPQPRILNKIKQHHSKNNHVFLKWCRGPESNRYGYYYPRDFKSRASASSATP
ncbi:MAG: hypothetical protein K0Q53_1791, partial [Massilibacillus sp.]|nr:hypothetical protein [Massilibacillus sp.]